MPPRHVFWTIIVEGKPTAFRAHTPEELLPTLRQLQSKHPDAVLKWFARGRLWDSREQEQMAAALKRRPAPGDRRPPTWRPGGEHRDPRERFKVPRDEKRRRFASNLRRDEFKPKDPRERHGGPPREGGWRPREERERQRDRPPREGGWKPPEERERQGGPPRQREGGWKPREQRERQGGPPRQREGGWKPREQRERQRPGGVQRRDRPEGGQNRSGGSPRDNRGGGRPGGRPPRHDRGRKPGGNRRGGGGRGGRGGGGGGLGQ